MKPSKSNTANIVIDAEVCKGCHLCIDQCPKHVLEISQNRSANGYLMPAAARIDDCITCYLCEMICPDLAMTVEVKKDEK